VEFNNSERVGLRGCGDLLNFYAPPFFSASRRLGGLAALNLVPAARDSETFSRIVSMPAGGPLPWPAVRDLFFPPPLPIWIPGPAPFMIN